MYDFKEPNYREIQMATGYPVASFLMLTSNSFLPFQATILKPYKYISIRVQNQGLKPYYFIVNEALISEKMSLNFGGRVIAE